MKKERLFPDYIFESSWEVCNKVGGIYAVLSTRAKTLKEKLGDNLVFIGPDCWGEKQSPYFEEDPALLKPWRTAAAKQGLNIKIGRWTVPGNPVAVLVDFQPYFAKKDEIYGELWEKYHVDSLHAYGDYDEASMFSYAAALVVESYYNYYISKKKRANKTIYHANEWMTGLGALYINDRLPQVATIFTTHATSIGRSIAGNNKPLYEYLEAYNGDQMAEELNMQSKQSIEKQTAAHVDCFTTVSEITARECAELLDKPVDVVLPNGFEDDFVPQGKEFDRKREAALLLATKYPMMLSLSLQADATSGATRVLMSLLRQSIVCVFRPTNSTRSLLHSSKFLLGSTVSATTLPSVCRRWLRARCLTLHSKLQSSHIGSTSSRTTAHWA